MTQPRRFRNLVGGRLADAADGAVMESADPSTGEVWASVPASSAADGAAAVEAARAAFPGWAGLHPYGRAAALTALADLVTRHAAELAEIETRDNGRVIRDTANGDLPGVAMIFRALAAEATTTAVRGESVQIGPTSTGHTRREPLGTVLAITPWNAPLPTLATKAGAALAAGNTVVVKPAEQASASSLRLAELVHEAGILPPGVFNVVSGLGTTVGDAMVRHRGVARVSLTGSSDTGRAVAAAAAGTLTRVALELGGKSPNIVFADADLDAAAVGTTTMSVFTGNAGQVCVAGSRVLVQESVLDDFLERMRAATASVRPGPPLDPATTMGPIVSAEQFKHVTGHIDRAIAGGARLVFGGGSGPGLFPAGSPLAGGWYVEPTLFLTGDNGLPICQEEVFGPVAVVLPFRDEADAVRIANDSRYGLAAGVWTTDLSRAHRVAARLDAGTVWVNTYRRMGVGLPFAGVKDSGYGHDSVLENTREKAILVELADVPWSDVP